MIVNTPCGSQANKKQSILQCSAKGLLQTETLLEAIHTAAGINELLLAGVEGMTLRADIHLQFLLGRTGFKRLTAHAANDTLAVLGMNLFLHCCFTSFAYAMIGQSPHELL